MKINTSYILDEPVICSRCDRDAFYFFIAEDLIYGETYLVGKCKDHIPVENINTQKYIKIILKNIFYLCNINCFVKVPDVVNICFYY
jgi:hypothetical protein